MSRAYTASPMQFLLWLRKSKLNQAGTAPVYLRIFLDTATRSEYATGERCLPSEWNATKGRLRGNDEASRNVNVRLKKLVAKAQLKADRLQDAVDEDPTLPAVHPADVAQALRPKPATANLLLPLLEQAAASITNPATRTAAGQALRWFRAWPPAARLSLAGLTPDVATQYVQWLGKQPLATSSKRVFLGKLTGLLALAAPTHPHVFAKLPRLLGTALDPPAHVLPADWRAQLESLSLPTQQALARDTFLLAYYLHGSRIGVVLELQWQHIDWQQKRIRFTTHKHPVAMDVQLRPEIGAILARYQPATGPLVLPWLPADYLSLDSKTQYQRLHSAANCVGQALKGISAKLGWPKLKPHMARHTLALTSYKKNNHDLRVPQQLLGHKNISTTAAYIARLDASELDQSAANAYD